MSLYLSNRTHPVESKAHAAVELRSEEVQEIMGQMPNSLIRWGITVIFSVLFLLLTATWFIRYPDSLTSRVILTTQNPPASLIARSDGRLQLFVRNGQSVKQGNFLAVLENPAHPEDVHQLVGQMEGFKHILYKDKDNGIVERYHFSENLILGELQTPYNDFINSLKEYNRTKALTGYEKQIVALRNRLVQYRQLDTQLIQQQRILAEQFTLIQKRISIDTSLFKEKVIAEIDLDRTKDTYLQSKRAFELAQINIINNRITVSELQSQITELEVTKDEKEGRQRNEVESTFLTLESQCQLWQQRYLLQTPINGKVAFVKYWSNNQFIKTGEEVLTIVPDTGQIFGQVMVPVKGSGKLAVGQNVHIGFDNFPFQEYGMVIGKVKSISPVPRDGLYTVQIILSNGLNTTYHRRLPFKQEMQGTAQIITIDLRLIERVFNQLRALLDKAG
jgi:multidrug efflux pump subunit AcrA (membrane-fusion protein)